MCASRLRDIKRRKCELRSTEQVARAVTLEHNWPEPARTLRSSRGQHLKAIQANGLCVETAAGEIVVQPAKATDDPMQVGPVDVIFLGVKAWQVEEAARNMQPMVGPQTLVVPLQNGVEARAARCKRHNQVDRARRINLRSRNLRDARKHGGTGNYP
jgi:hypothetical protein